MKKNNKFLIIMLLVLLLAVGCKKETTDNEKPKEAKKDVEKKIADDAKKYIEDKYNIDFDVISTLEVIFEENISGPSATGDYKITFSDGTVVFYTGSTKKFSDSFQATEILLAIDSEIIEPLFASVGFVEESSKHLFYIYGTRNYVFYDGDVYFEDKYDGNIKKYLEDSNVKISFHDIGIKMLHLVTSDKTVAKSKIGKFMDELGKYFDTWGSRILVVAVNDGDYVGNILTYDLNENEKVLVAYYFEGRGNPHEIIE